jgi:hypothetical protein
LLLSTGPPGRVKPSGPRPAWVRRFEPVRPGKFAGLSARALNASIEIHPVMVPEDLARAGGAIEAAVKKYG